MCAKPKLIYGCDKMKGNESVVMDFAEEFNLHEFSFLKYLVYIISIIHQVKYLKTQF